MRAFGTLNERKRTEEPLRSFARRHLHLFNDLKHWATNHSFYHWLPTTPNRWRKRPRPPMIFPKFPARKFSCSPTAFPLVTLSWLKWSLRSGRKSWNSSKLPTCLKCGSPSSFPESKTETTSASLFRFVVIAVIYFGAIPFLPLIIFWSLPSLSIIERLSPTGRYVGRNSASGIGWMLVSRRHFFLPSESRKGRDQNRQISPRWRLQTNRRWARRETGISGPLIVVGSGFCGLCRWWVILLRM